MIRLIIAGSRNYDDYDKFKEIMSKYLLEVAIAVSDIESVISGGAAGVDTLAERWAKENNLPCKVIVAEWSKYGNRAGPIRNTLMIAQGTNLVAFPSKSGRGTQDTIRKAEAIKMPFKVYYID